MLILLSVRDDSKGCYICRGRLQDSTMVHDEEAEISIRLATLIANTQRNRSTIEPLPLNASEAPGTAAAADGDAAAKAEVSQGTVASSFGCFFLFYRTAYLAKSIVSRRCSCACY